MQMNDQAKARLTSMMKTWERRKKIGEHLNQIKNRVAVYSGKGGVGKTTIAVNLAVALAQAGHKVGLLDADIDCPNADKLLGVMERPRYIDGVIHPPQRAGVKTISMASFQENEDEAIIWRGPMVTNAINQFLEMTEWGELDYLIVDLPPGTSDAPLTIMQTLQLHGFVVVTTPQDLAVLDAKRSINMIKKMNIDILGVVENMAGDVFGKGGGERLARDLGVPFLGRVELAKEFGEMGADLAILKNKKVQKRYQEIAEATVQRLSELTPAPQISS
jgi:ATP-binding protein involved in chromosome partitioning